jgi:hypothetical protein
VFYIKLKKVLFSKIYVKWTWLKKCFQENPDRETFFCKLESCQTAP